MVSNTTGSIGNNSGSTGVATVTGPVSHWNNSGELSVGRGGTGTLNIQAGGLVSDSTGNLGFLCGLNGHRNGHRRRITVEHLRDAACRQPWRRHAEDRGRGRGRR